LRSRNPRKPEPPELARETALEVCCGVAFKELVGLLVNWR